MLDSRRMEYQITASINFSSSGNPLEHGSRENRWQLVGCRHPFPPTSSARDHFTLSRSRESQLDLRFLIRESLSPCSSSGVFSLMCFEFPFVYSVPHAVASFDLQEDSKSRQRCFSIIYPIASQISQANSQRHPSYPTPPPYLLSLIPQSPVPVSRLSHRLPLSTRLVPRLPPLDIIQYLRSIKECIASSLLLAHYLDHSFMIKVRGGLTIYPVQRGC